MKRLEEGLGFRSLGLALLYFLTGHLGLQIAPAFGFATLTWAPSGIALAALLLFGRALWPGVFLGAFVVNVVQGAPIWVSLGIAIGNTLEAFVGAWALTRDASFTPSLSRLRDAVRFLLIAVFGATALSATIGVLTLWSAQIVPTAGFLYTLRVWWIGDALGNLIIAPVLLSWLYSKPNPLRAISRTEVVIVMIWLIATAASVFNLAPSPFPLNAATGYWLFLPMAWVALRFSQRGTLAANAVLSLMAVLGALGHGGPFVGVELSQSLYQTQLFMSVVATTMLLMSAIMSEAKNSEERALENQTLKHAILHSMTDGLLTLDASGVIRDANSAAERIFRYRHSELIGKEMAALLIPAAFRERHREELFDLQVEGEPKRLEMPAMRADGTIILVETAICRLVFPKETVYSVYLRDITEKKEWDTKITALNSSLERRVEERTRQLTAAMHELESFSYSASHDLRTPLRAIDGFSRSILERNPTGLDEETRQDFQRVRNAAQRMGDLIDALLILSRVSRSNVRLESVSLSTLASEAIDELRAIEPNRSVEVRVSSDLLVYADRELMRIAIANLLNNAWKFTSKRDQARIEISSFLENGEVIYFVKDNGLGFPMQFVGKLFKAFERLHEGTEYPGAGIGLATVQRIVHRHGGRIWAAGEPDQGCTIYFTLGAPARHPALH